MQEINTKEGGVVIPIPIEDEVKKAYRDYSMSVIVSRALPDVRDGLKPVHNLGTHGHLDHHFGDAAILSAFNLLPEVSDGDEVLMQHSKEAALQMLGMDLNIDLPAGELRLTENNTISFGSHTFRIIRTPGHSRGSVSFYCAEENVLFTGDTLFKGSIGRTDFPGGSMFQIISSLRELAQLPDTTIVYPGHGPQTSIGFELAHNPYMDR